MDDQLSSNDYGLDWSLIRTIREQYRQRSGGGGMCHKVSNWIASEYGLARLDGSYCINNEVSVSPHYWNILPDGSILDCTADQMGEGYDMRIIPLSDPDHLRYNEEWHQDFNPTLPDYKPYIPTGGRRLEHFTGESDFAQQERLILERGLVWAVTHPQQLLVYLNQQIEYADRINDRRSLDFFNTYVKALSERTNYDESQSSSK